MARLDQLYHQIDMDNATLEGLAKYGDDPKKEHAVEHHFFASDITALKNLSAIGSKLGFTSSQINQGDSKDGVKYHYFDLVSNVSLLPLNVYRESLLMFLLGECHGAEYDGWGTSVEK